MDREKIRLVNFRTFLEKIKNKGFTYVSGEYKNKESNIRVICPNGHFWMTNAYRFPKGCPECKKEKKLIPLAEKANELFLTEGYKIVSEFKGRTKLIIVKCPKGHNWKTSLYAFENGVRCSHCYDRGRHTVEEAREIFIQKNLIPMFDTYKNNIEPLPYLCPSHKNYGTQYVTLHSIVSKNGGCKWCNIEKNSGEFRYNWKGGVTSLKEFLRKGLYELWTLPSLEKYSFKCAITGLQKDLEVHHLNKNFSEIADEAIFKHDIGIKKNIGDYEKETLVLLKRTCVELHLKYGLGVPLHKDVHKLFHSIYGKENNTPEQFEEFQNRCENGEFETFLHSLNN